MAKPKSVAVMIAKAWRLVFIGLLTMVRRHRLLGNDTTRLANLREAGQQACVPGRARRQQNPQRQPTVMQRGFATSLSLLSLSENSEAAMALPEKARRLHRCKASATYFFS